MVVRAQVMPETVRCVTNNRFRLQPYLRTPGTRVLETGLGDIECYADLNVSEYFVGAGPTTLTILAYWRSYWDDSLSEAEIATKRKTVEDIIADGLPGYEGVVFIGIPVNAAIETWTAVAVWDLERRDDGTIIAVHPDRDWWMDPDRFQPGYRELVEFTLPAFRTAATAAYASMLAKYDGRIDEAENLPMLVTNASNLRSFHVETGNVNHPDGPPTQPPPACGKAVPDQAGNPGLMRDCMALLDAKDALRGAEALNWSVDTTIADWDGITTGGTPSRVTKVEVDDEDLTGTIPAELGSLTGLTHLDLSDNSLTGDIPAELGLLSSLVSVKLSGNSLTGCIPVALQSVATNDLSSLNLLYCQPPAPGAPTAGTVTETSVPLSWTAASNVSTYRIEYRDGDSGDWTVDSESITTTSHTVDELACGTAYQFRLSAYGSGTTYAAAWSDPSEALTASTGACTPPVFGATSYSFSVMEDAAVDAPVGTVSATDDDTVTYAITAGNDAGLVAIGEATGAITVAADLSGQSGTTVTLTVAARDTIGSEATVTVAVAITGTCDSGTAVSNPTSNPGLVADCKTLLGLHSALAGTATLNWSADLAMSAWRGISIGDAPRRVIGMNLRSSGLGGAIPAALGDLTGLEDLWLNRNRLTGEIPAELGNLTSLYTLYLDQNQLTGEIPAELGNLGRLEDLYLFNNQLTGSIPPEVGGLEDLRQLWISNNQFTGVLPGELGSLTGLKHLDLSDNSLTEGIPAELGSLTGLKHLDLSDNSLTGGIPAELGLLHNVVSVKLSGNSLTGCIPLSLQDVPTNDLDDLGLPDCVE